MVRAMTRAAYLVDGIRSPFGRYGGGLGGVRADDLAASVIAALVARTKIPQERIDDVVLGCANQAGEDNRNVARMAALLAGLPVTVPGITVNRLCASGLQAVMDAARTIQCGDGAILLAGGVESMTRAPFVMLKSSGAWNRQPEMVDTTIGWRFINGRLSGMHYPYSMGETAEQVASRWKITREEQDVFAFESQERYFRAFEQNKW